MLNGGIATFTPGSQEATVEIRALADAIQEPDEMFTIEARLAESSTPLGVVIGGDGRAGVTVSDSLRSMQGDSKISRADNSLL